MKMEFLSEEDYFRFMKVFEDILKEIQEGKTKGRTYKQFIEEGVSVKGMNWLKRNHYITWVDKDKTSVWLAYENELYPDQTISMLQHDAHLFGII